MNEIIAKIDNPIIKNTEDYRALREALLKVDMYFSKVIIDTDRVYIENKGSRTFRFRKNPSIEWIVGRLRYMKSKGL